MAAPVRSFSRWLGVLLNPHSRFRAEFLGKRERTFPGAIREARH